MRNGIDIRVSVYGIPVHATVLTQMFQLGSMRFSEFWGNVRITSVSWLGQTGALFISRELGIDAATTAAADLRCIDSRCIDRVMGGIRPTVWEAAGRDDPSVTGCRRTTRAYRGRASVTESGRVHGGEAQHAREKRGRVGGCGIVKRWILDELCAVTGWRHKHAIVTTTEPIP
jgi:hypothetical protein